MEEAKNICIPGCLIVNCLGDSDDIILSLVVPSKIQENEIEKRCSVGNNVKRNNKTDMCIGRNKELNRGIIEDLNSGEIIIISLIILALLCCIGFIVYYNYKVPNLYIVVLQNK